MDDANVVSGEFDVYRLQLCRGKVSALDSESMTSSFSDVYEGPNTSHLVTNLDHNVQYSVRVSGQSYSDSVGASWSPWSLPVTWFTSLPRRGLYHSLYLSLSLSLLLCLVLDSLTRCFVLFCHRTVTEYCSSLHVISNKSYYGPEPDSQKFLAQT